MTSQYGAYALRAGLARLYARMRMHTPTRSGTHMHARKRKHAHTWQYVAVLPDDGDGVSPRNVVFLNILTRLVARQDFINSNTAFPQQQ